MILVLKLVLLKLAVYSYLYMGKKYINNSLGL